MKNQDRAGVTFVEMLVYIIIFAMFLGMVSAVFTWMRHSQGSVKRLDIFHQLRASSFQISEQVAYGAGIISPAMDPSGKPANQLVFRNAANEVIALFLNKKKQLVQLNWTYYCTGRKPYLSVLTNNTILFRVKRPSHFYVEFDLRMEDEKEKEFSLTNSVRLRNIIK